MADAAGSVADGSAGAPATPPTRPASEVASDKGRGRAEGRSRIVRPRIDIDDQIREANRVSELLKKMGQAAKTLKKSQTKAKQRLVKKASRLSPTDLERIAVLKRAFSGSAEQAQDDAASSPSQSSGATPGPAKGVADLHATLKEMMKGVDGASDVVEGLGATYTQQDKRDLAMASAEGPTELLAGEEGAPRAKAIKRLPSLRRLPSGALASVGTDGTNFEESQSVQE